MPIKPSVSGVVWADLLAPLGDKDVGAAVQSILAALDVAQGPEQLCLDGLAKAVGPALQALDPQRALLGSAALLLALDDEDATAADIAAVAGDNDSLYAGLSSALSSGAPLTAAAAARALCALAAASGNAGALAQGQGQGNDRHRHGHEKQARSRRVAPQLRALLDAHPRSVQVQEAIAGGCCELLASERVALGGHAGFLWGMLWPLALHHQESVAKAAELCISRLTWLAKTQQTGASGGSVTSTDVPSAEVAIARACAEFSDGFKLVEAASRQGGPPSPAARLAERQCVRLLSLLGSLLRYGRSVVQDVGRKDKSQCLDDSILVIPVSKLVGMLNALVTSIFRDSAVALRVLSLPKGGLASTLCAALELAQQLAATAGTALQPFSGRLRLWLEVLTEVAPSTHWRHCRATCSFALTLAETVPAVLLNTKVIGRLVDFSLALLQPCERDSASSAQARAASGQQKRKKRKAGEALGGEGQGSGSAIGSIQEHEQPAFPAACLLLARLAALAAPLLTPQQVAAICERVARLLWLGLCAPTPEQAARAGSGDVATEKAAAMSSFSQAVCREVPCILALLDIIKSLHQHPRPGVVPLAPSLQDAFARLLAIVASAHRRRAAVGASSPIATSASSASCAAVVARAVEVREALLAVAADWSEHSRLSERGAESLTVVSFTWPETAPTPASVPAQPASGPGAAQEQGVESATATAAATAAAEVAAPPTPASVPVLRPEERPAAEQPAAEPESLSAPPGTDSGTVAGTGPGPAAAEVEAEGSASQLPAPVADPAPVAEPLAVPAPAPTLACASETTDTAETGGMEGTGAGVGSQAATALAEATATSAPAPAPTTAPTGSASGPATGPAPAQDLGSGASSEFLSLPELPAGSKSLAGSGSLELFPDMGDVSPIPSLCMDSPTDEDL